jgi:hypothetical protein
MFPNSRDFDFPEEDLWGRIAPGLPVICVARGFRSYFENIDNSVKVMHEEGVLAPYEVCSEQVHRVLQQAVEWF